MGGNQPRMDTENADKDRNGIQKFRTTAETQSNKIKGFSAPAVNNG